MAIILSGGPSQSPSGSVGLKQIRQLFVRATGRYDLENVDGTDNGANWFIQAGQRFLDRQVFEAHGRAKAYSKVKAISNIATFSRCRALQEVYLLTNDGRKRLDKISFSEMQCTYPKVPDPSWAGTPLYYAIAAYRLANENLQDIDIPAMYMDTTTAETRDFNSVIIGPCTNEDIVLELIGLFYSLDLTSDDSVSYWTTSHPDLLVQAAVVKLEGFYRNYSGHKDAMAALMKDVQDLDMDAVAQLIVDVDQMEG